MSDMRSSSDMHGRHMASSQPRKVEWLTFTPVEDIVEGRSGRDMAQWLAGCVQKAARCKRSGVGLSK